MPNSGDPEPTGPLSPIGPGRSAASEPAAGPCATSSTAGAEPAAAARDVERSQELDAITEALASGAIDAQVATEQLIERTVRAQLPPDAAPELIAAVRAEVEAVLASDPMLERLLRP